MLSWGALPQRASQVQIGPMEAAATAWARAGTCRHVQLLCMLTMLNAPASHVQGNRCTTGSAHLWKQQHWPEVCVPSSHRQHASLHCS